MKPGAINPGPVTDDGEQADQEVRSLKSLYSSHLVRLRVLLLIPKTRFPKTNLPRRRPARAPSLILGPNFHENAVKAGAR